MDRATLQHRESELRASRVPFVHARVVLADRPTSAKPGDEALILADGTFEGFVGGDCAEAAVRENSRELLTSGEARLVRITPEPEADQAGKVVVHNPCLSGGTLEIFLEPEVPAPRLVVLGSSPVARSLAELGEHLGYEAIAFDGSIPIDTAAVVVASHGRDDEHAALTAALRAEVDYVALVASARRGAGVLARLDVDDEQRARVHTPAGLDIGARTAGEIALSILAEITAERPRRVASGADAEPAAEPERATDPVCGMSVAMIETAPSLDHDGRRVWFCCHGCKQAFAADPAAYGA